MKLVADPIILPDDASWQDIEDAKLSAKWHEIKSLEYLMSLTNLDGKCGSCKNFKYCKEREPITTKYPNFRNWVQNINYIWW